MLESETCMKRESLKALVEDFGHKSQGWKRQGDFQMVFGIHTIWCTNNRNFRDQNLQMLPEIQRFNA